jgi:release factor glutamine methyltransferase
MHTVKAALEEAMATIERVDAHVLMAHVLGVNRAYLAANPMRVLTESEDAKVDMLVAQRALGQPVAYLVEKREFYGRDFVVGPDVLIPRPETETLVEAALARLAAHVSSPMPRPSCVDLGTGSGAIAVTLACERLNAAVTATDASAAAIEVARANAEAHACRVELLQGSWYEPLAGRRFDLIVANPPYVAAQDTHLSQGDLRFEPPGALTDGSRDGLDSIRAIVAGASDHLNARGWLLLEHGYDQAQQVEALLKAAGFRETLSIADLAGIPRVAGGKIS